MKYLNKSTILGAMIALSVLTQPSYAISEQSIQTFGKLMHKAVNGQNIGKVSQLIAEDAIISLTRKGKTATLDKNAYLQLLQKSWANATNYNYRINISDVIVTGEQARANFVIVETWDEQGGKRTTLTTRSKATLSEVDGNTVLLRAVVQVSRE